MILVAPRNNMVIIDPFSGRPVPDDGLMIDETEPFWHRRLCDGDVVRIDAPVEAPQAEPTEPTEQEAAPVVADQETPEPAKPEKKNRRKRED